MMGAGWLALAMKVWPYGVLSRVRGWHFWMQDPPTDGLFGMRVRFSNDDRYLFVGRDLNRWRRSGSLAVWKTDNWSQIHLPRSFLSLYETSASGVFSAHGPEGIHLFDLTSEKGC